MIGVISYSVWVCWIPVAPDHQFVINGSCSMFTCRLSGISPFLGDTDAETCQNVSVGEYDYDEEFPAVSKDAKDFIDGLLIRNPRWGGWCSVALQGLDMEYSGHV